MLLQRAIARSSLLKTHRFTRRFQSSSSSSEDFYSSSSSSSSSRSTMRSPPSDPTPPSINPTVRNRSTFFLQFAAFSAVASLAGTAAYATFAYTADEIDEKTKTFRSSVSHSSDSPVTIESIPHRLYTAVMSVPSKAVSAYLELRRLIEEHVQEIAEPLSDKLLPEMDEMYRQIGAMTLVLDLRGTLIYSEWKRETGWCTYKRPGLDDFLERMASMYEVVVFSDDQMDDQIMSAKLMEKGVRHFLTRSHTKYQDGKHYRDLSKLNRDPSKIIYVSAQALENCLQPENSIPIKPWKKEVDDTTLIDLLPFLEFVGISKPDIRGVLASYEGKDIPTEFIQRSKRVLKKQSQNPLRRIF